MIEQAVYEHLKAQNELAAFLATFNGDPAIFNQEAPADVDELWGRGSQYGRVVFTEDLQGDPERLMGGSLVVDVMCKENEQFPEEIEPIIRNLIHGYFFSNGTFTVAAQWKTSSYFTQPTDEVTGCTITFELLGFPVITTSTPDVINRINEWTAENFRDLHVINYDELPETAWKPTDGASAIYWRVAQDATAGWIPDTCATIWRTATIKGHIFSEDHATAATVARDLSVWLTAAKRLVKAGETQIMVNRTPPAIDLGADPLRTGQVTVQGTYGIVVYFNTSSVINNINYEEENPHGNQS